jgi:hypothetical protein
VIEAPTWEGAAQQAKVAGVNPLKQIPALVTPDGETITESAAILIWLADRFPEARLAPALRFAAARPVPALDGVRAGLDLLAVLGARRSLAAGRVRMLRSRRGSRPRRPTASPTAGR